MNESEEFLLEDVDILVMVRSRKSSFSVLELLMEKIQNSIETIAGAGEMVVTETYLTSKTNSMGTLKTMSMKFVSMR